MTPFPMPSNNPLAPEPRLGSSDKSDIPLIKSVFENNYMQVRRAATRKRKIFELEYSNLTLAEFSILEEHFNNNVGDFFTFIHPVELVSYNVTYSTGELEKSYVSFGVVNTKVILESI